MQLAHHLTPHRKALRLGRRYVMRLYNLGPVAFRSLSLRQCTETDSLEFSDLAINFEEAQAFRAATLDHIRISLKLDYTAPG